MVQRPIDLSDGSQIRLTIARYYTPVGRNIQKPYEASSEEYHNDVLKRLKHGELMNQDSIKFPDSLKYKTLIKQRTVYGGGGIMPDVFVPLDTNEFTKYFRSILGTGAFNTFSLTYVNKNREKLKVEYPNFEGYLSKFNCDKVFMDDFFNYLSKEHPTLKLEDKEYPESEKLVKLFLKAMVAQDLWGATEFYRIYNERNAILQAALKTLKDGSFEKAGLE